MSNITRRWIFVGAIALLAIMLLGCIKIGGKEPVVTPVPPTPTPVPPTPTPIPPTPTPVPEAKPEIVAVSLCRGLTDDDKPFAETNTYTQIDPFVVSVQVANMKPKNIVSAHWYQGDNLIGLTEKDSVTGDDYVGLTLDPQGSWMPGDYTLEVSLDGKLDQSLDFSVIGMAKLPGAGGGANKEKGTGDWETYREDDLGFAIAYPASWLVDEGGSAVEFTHPQNTAIALVMVNTEPESTAEQEAEAVFATISQKLSDVQKSSSQAQEDGEWHGISFTYNDNGTDVVGVLLSKVVGSRGYHILFLVVRKQWESIVPTLEQMWVSFEIEGEGEGAPGTSDVLLEGIFLDGDTKRSIPYALFVILKEGVTVKQFVDSGNDESLVYDSAQSGDDGTFKINVPVKRGATYAVFAVAKGYKPVVDVMNVPDQVTSPWNVTVTMQKE
jgi:hypothetical protein